MVVKMLENIAVSVSTVIFLLCSFLMGSIMPAKQDVENPPSEPPYIAGTADTADTADTAGTADCMAEVAEEFQLTGVWECFGHRYEFKSDGRLIAEGETLSWKFSGGDIIIGYDDESHTLAFEPLDSRTMRLDGKTFYRIS